MDHVYRYDPDEVVECPYDRSHRPLRKRLQYHLMDCRKNNPHLKFKICPFNATHHVPKSELRNHMASCPNRAIIDLEREYASRESHDNPMKGCTGLPVYENFNIPSTEEWGDEDDDRGFDSGLRMPSVIVRSPFQQPRLQAREQPYSSVFAYSVGTGRGRGNMKIGNKYPYNSLVKPIGGGHSYHYDDWVAVSPDLHIEGSAQHYCTSGCINGGPGLKDGSRNYWSLTNDN